MRSGVEAFGGRGVGLVVLSLVLVGSGSLAQESVVFEGVLEAVVGDPFGFVGGHVVFYYLFSGGQRFELVVGHEVPGEWIGRVVQVQGVLEEGKVVASDVTLVEGAPDGPGLSPVGPQSTVVLLVKYNDQAGVEPQPLGFFSSFVFGLFPSLRTLWELNAYNALSVVNSGVYGWFVLPNTQAGYNAVNTTFPSTTSPNTFGMLYDALAVASSVGGVQVPDNSRVLLFVNNWTGCCAYGTLGFGTFPTPYGSRTLSVSWLPIWAYEPGSTSGVHTVGHEYGHNLGFLHSGNTYAVYDSPWDTVSRGCVPEGAYTIVKNKVDAGWLPAGDYATVSSTQFLETTVYPLTSASGLRGVKITTPDSNVYYTVEVRRKVGHDVCLPNQGVLIHKVNTSAWDWVAKPVDATPGDFNLSNAQWSYGQLYTDPAYQFSVEVVSPQPNDGTLIRVIPPGFTLSQCGTFSYPGVYMLSNDVSSFGTCFTVQANSVVLDCQGHTVTYGSGAAGSGVSASNVNNFVVKNCRLSQGAPIADSHAVSLNNVNNAQVVNNVISTLGYNAWGVSDWGGNYPQGGNHVFVNNTVSTAGHYAEGITVTFGGNNTIHKNTISTQGIWARGVTVSTSSNNTVSFNKVSTSYLSATGMEIAASDGKVVSNSIVTSGAGSPGLTVCCYTFNNNIVLNNTILTTGGSGAKGLKIGGGGNTVVGNRIRALGGPTNVYGIEVSIGGSPPPNVIYNNVVNASGSPVSVDQNANFWNGAYQSGTNVVGGPYLGGNFYAAPNGTGFSETCSDSSPRDGVCDQPLVFPNGQNTDFLPLAKPLVAAPVLSIIGTPSVGGMVVFNVSDAGNPGRAYLVAFSLGTFPGIPLGDGRTVPLNPDVLFFASLDPVLALQLGLSGTQGTLNAVGLGAASWMIPNVLQAVGLTVYAAFVTVDPALALPVAVRSISPAVPVTIL